MKKSNQRVIDSSGHLKDQRTSESTDEPMNRSTDEPMNRRGREDFVQFRLKASAPDFVALGGARFSGAFARAQEPFEATRGEWKVFLERTGFFEEIE